MHTIHDIAFDVNINYNDKSVSWEQYYVNFFKEKLLPRVAHVCDNWDKKHPNTKCTIDSIEINVEVNDIDLQSLTKEIMQQINQQLMSINADGSSRDGKLIAKTTREASAFDALVTYLSSGILPAHISVKAFKDWLNAIVEFTSVERTKLRTIFATNSETIARMLSLLRNDYEKLLSIIESKQQITSNYVTLEATFFQEFLKAITKSFTLNYATSEAKIWHQTLGFSTSVTQFSKTLLQLLQPKAKAEGKQLKNCNEKQLSIALIQAITQYEAGKEITINASTIAKVTKDITVKTETSTTNTISENKTRKEATQKTTDKTVKTTEKSSTTNTEEANRKKRNLKLADEQKQVQTKNSVENSETKNASAKDQSITEATGKSANDLQNSNEKNGTTNNKGTDKEEHKSRKEARTNLAEADKQKRVTDDIGLTTEKSGLILLNPFIKRFLSGVELLTENNEINDFGRACMLLHYLATETENGTDVEFTLEKILLGIPQETIVDYETPLTESDKNACEELLRAILEHWTPLKRSTINTLRDMFLKRDGVLKITEEDIKLTVEGAAQDILLKQVPWNISLIRLKWMEKMLHIEW
ncbi:contractile injection system tape measure protein [Kordia algicida OT-1]|uniref:Uncharacterized protein n=1 Tax=Kordia algicida OT-1 TaxID=391587 RepID=A9DX65_9FLAO|nr:contractile injection system tape measure protein [Kordia algicida]EDP95966.1 hypothetical protein KAOT1_07353 [Kordia algicida OT-1]